VCVKMCVISISHIYYGFQGEQNYYPDRYLKPFYFVNLISKQSDYFCCSWEY